MEEELYTKEEVIAFALQLLSEEREAQRTNDYYRYMIDNDWNEEKSGDLDNYIRTVQPKDIICHLKKNI